jgi:tape measure domain-containing protein
MSFTIHVGLEGGEKAADGVAKIETGLNKTTDAAGRARDAMGRFAGSAADAGDRASAGADKAAAAHGRAKAATEGTGDAMTNLIHLAEAYIAVHQIEGIVDGYIEIRNKTNSVSTSAENLNAVMEEQFRIAQATRSSWEDLAGTYQRISNAGRGLGLSQREILDLTQELSMGMRLSGSSSREASMTMMELTHAFTVGTLTGREFRVMMKDAPALMHELQVVSGHTGAEFAEMGKHGKFTAQTLIEWFGKAKESIADKFGATIPTIAEGFQLIKNAAEKFFGESAVGSGVMERLSAAMKFVADHFETIGKTALAVGEALIALFVIEKITTMVKGLTIALAENPLTALLVVLTVGISLLRQFGDEMETSTKAGSGFVTVGDTLRAVWEELKRLGEQVVQFVDESWSRLASAFSDGIETDGLEKSTADASTIIAKFVTGSVGLLHFLGDSVITIFGGIPLSIGEMFVNMAKAVVHVVEQMVNGIIAGINKVIEAKNYVASLMPGDHGPTMTPDAQNIAAGKWASDMNKKYHLEGGIGIGNTAEENAQRDAGMKAALEAGYRPTAAGFAPGMHPGGAGGMVAANLIKPVDLSFTTALDGAAEAFDRKIQDDWKRDVTDGIARIESDAVKRAQQRQYDNLIAANVKAAQGGVSTTKGTPDAAIHDEKAAKALEKYQNQLRAIEEQTNPVVAAQEKLAHAQQFLTDAVAHHGLSQERANLDMENYRRKLADALDPMGAWVRKQGEATAALRDTAEEQDRATKLTAFSDEMRKAGLVLTDQQLEQASRLIAASQQRAEQMRAEQAITQQLEGGQHAYQVQLAALGDLLERGRLTSIEYAVAMDQVRAAYLSTGEASKTAAAGVERAQILLRQSSQGLQSSHVGSAAEKLLTDAKTPAVQYAAQLEALAAPQTRAALTAEEYAHAVDQVRAAYLAATPAGKTFAGGAEQVWLKMKADAENFGATVAGQLVGDVDKLNEAIISAANGGEVAWGRMVDAMIQDLERLLIKQIEVGIINAVVSAYTDGAVTGAGSAVVGAGGAAADIGASAAAPSPAAASVGPGAYPMPGAASMAPTPQAAAPPAIIEIHNHYDESVTHAAMQSTKGRQIFVNLQRGLPAAIRR